MHISQLLSPESQNVLREAIKDRKSTISKIKVEEIGSLGSIDFLNKHINNSLLIYPYVTANNHKSSTSQRDLIENSIDKYSNAREVELSKKNLLYRVAKGDTLVINKLQKFDSKSEDVCDAFSELFRSKTNVNLYYSYKNTIGINVHFDYQDTLVIQTHGTKKWKLFNGDKGKTSLPVGKNHKPNTEDKDGFLEVTTRVGDILFIPKGVWHYASTINDSSIHLSLSLTPLKVNELIKHLLNNHLDELGEKDLYQLTKSDLINELESVMEKLKNVEITDEIVSSIKKEVIPEKYTIELQ